MQTDSGEDEMKIPQSEVTFLPCALTTGGLICEAQANYQDSGHTDALADLLKNRVALHILMQHTCDLYHGRGEGGCNMQISFDYVKLSEVIWIKTRLFKLKYPTRVEDGDILVSKAENQM